MQGTSPLGGSPQNESCANTYSQRTANNSSLPESKKPASDQPGHTTDPVPLYLIPQALSAEIHRLGDAIAEVDIRRTRGHNYLITVRESTGRGDDRAA